MSFKEVCKNLGVIVFAVGAWFGIAASGYGAQSLTIIFEIPFVIIIAIIIYLALSKWKYYQVLLLIFLVIFLIRTFAPAFPE